MGAVRKVAYRLGRILAKIRASFLLGFYSVHVRIRKLHDKSYSKGGWYKDYSDVRYTSAIHKTVLVAFVASFAFFTLFQVLLTGYLTRPQEVRAGANSVTWTSDSHFQNNGPAGSNFTGETMRTNIGTSGNNVSLPPGQQHVEVVGLMTDLESTHFTGPNVGYAVGAKGVILKTTNSGATWSALNSGSSSRDYSSIYFTDANTGYVTGDETLKTTDAGATWSKLSIGTTNFMFDIYFTDANTGYVVGTGGMILKTTNAGDAWTPQVSGVTSALHAVHFASSEVGAAVGQGGKILRTTDAGANWVAQTSGITTSLYSVHLTSADTGYASGYNGRILKTTNAGSNWNLQTSGTSYNLNDIRFSDASTGYAVGDGGTILKTTNAGVNWNSLTSGTTQEIYDINYTDANTGYVVGEAGTMMKTINAGSSWSPVILRTNNNFNDVYFTDASTGYIIGSSAILKTTNAGLTWNSLNHGTSGLFNDIYFTDANTGYVVGNTGFIMKTENAGASWSQQVSGTIETLFGVFFTDTNNGYAVGQNGTILKTENAGASWSQQVSGTTKMATAVQFLDTNIGYVVGSDGLVLKTENAGALWNTLTPGTFQSLQDVYFIDANVGYVVGGAGIIRKTTNGGANWSTSVTGVTSTLNSIHFIDDNTAYTSGSSGLILKTTNAGASWSGISPTGAYPNLIGIYFVDANTGFAVGDWGRINKIYSDVSSPGTISGLKINSGNGSMANWSRLSWNGITPQNTAIKFRTRGANTEGGLSSAGWSDYYTSSGSSIATANSQWLEIELTLESLDLVSTPTLNDFTVTFDSLESPKPENMSLLKTDGSNIQKNNGVVIGLNEPGGFTNETAIKVIATGLTCGGGDSGETPCGIVSTNTRPQVEVEPVGTAFDGATNLFSADLGSNFAVATGLTTDISYHIQVRAIDDQGRASSWTSYGDNLESEADFTIEQTSPTGTVTIGGANVQGSYARSRDVALTITGQDNGSVKSSASSDQLKMRFSNDGTTWSDWEVYATSKNWILADGTDGARSVYLQLKDNAGNTSGQINNPISSYESVSVIDSTQAYSIKLSGPSSILNLQPDSTTGIDYSLGSNGTIPYDQNGQRVAAGYMSGTWDDQCECYVGGYTIYALFRFVDLYNIPANAVINYARLSFNDLGTAPWQISRTNENIESEGYIFSPTFAGVASNQFSNQNIDVKNGVQQMIGTKRGFMISGNFNTNIASSENGDPSIRPKLELQYSIPSGPPYGTGGVYTSSVINNSASHKFGKVKWSQSLPLNTDVVMKIRSGATATPDATWTNWVTVNNNQEINELTDDNNPARKLGDKQYIQYQLTLNTSDDQKTPVIDDVFIEVGTKISASITLDTTKPSQVSGLEAYSDNQLGTQFEDGKWYTDSTPYFKWSANPEGDIAGYRYCQTSNCTPDTPLAPSVNSNLYQSSNLTNEGKYYFRVAAVDNAGNLSQSVTQFVYGYDSTAPIKVTGLSATKNRGNSIFLQWNQYSDQGAPAEKYMIERVLYNQPGGYNCPITRAAAWDDINCAGFKQITINSGTTLNTTEYVPADIDSGKKYAYRIKAKDFAHDEYGEWNKTNSDPLETGYTLDTTDPTPQEATSITVLSCDGTENTCPVNENEKGFSAKISWLKFLDPGSGVNRYKIFRSDTASVENPANWKVVGVVTPDNPDNPTNLVWYDNDTTNLLTFGSDKPAATDLLNDYTAYYYRITAVDNATDINENPAPNESDLLLPLDYMDTNSGWTQTFDVTSSLPPDYVTATAIGLDGNGQAESDPNNLKDKQQINIDWSEAVDVRGRSVRGEGDWQGIGVDGYKIFRDVGQGYVEITSDPTLSCDFISRHCINFSLTDKTQYSYKIKSYDKAGNQDSVLSGAAAATTYSGDIPTMPGSLNIEAQKGEPTSSDDIGHVINISFKGSQSKNNQVVKYEIYRSETNYSLTDDWLNLATKLNVSALNNCDQSNLSCNYQSDSGGADITIDSPVGDDRDRTYSIKDSGLTDAKTYYYRVRAQDNSFVEGIPEQSNRFGPLTTVLGPDSPTDGWDIIPDLTPPAQPQSLKVRDIYGDGVNYLRNIITWERIAAPDRNGSNDFKEYKLYRSTDGLAWSQVLENGNNPLANSNQELAMATNYYIDLVPIASANQYYYYYVTSIDDAGTAFKYANNTVINPFSNESIPPKDNEGHTVSVSLNPAIAYPTITKNGQYAPALTYVGVSSATLRWYADQPTDSVVEYRAVGGPKWITAGDREAININDAHVVNLVGLSPKTTYEYRLISRNYLGNEDVLGDIDSEKLNLPTLTTKEFLVANVQKTTTTSTAEISWQTNLDAASAFVEYQLQKQPGDDSQSGTAGVTIENLASSPQSHRVILKGLRSSRTYSFKVKSISKDGFVAESALDYFRTQSFDAAQFVIAPNSSNLAERNITATSAQIVWSTAVPTTSWVDYGTTSGKYDYSAGDNNLNSSHNVKLENLASGSTYYYRVRVKDVNEVEYVSQEYSFRAIAKPKISNITIKEITPYSITLAWETNVPTDTLINWGTTSAYGERRGKAERVNNHELKVDNLLDDVEYHYQIVSRDEYGNEVVDEDKAVRTPLDKEGPKIISVKTDVMPLGENESTGQVIISWETNKPATTLVQYDEGVIGGKYSKSTIEDKSLNVSHTVIIKDLEAATTYHFRIISKDRRENQTISNDYTFLTPGKEKSILQLILKALEETFSWVGNVGTYFKGLGQKAK